MLFNNTLTKFFKRLDCIVMQNRKIVMLLERSKDLQNPVANKHFNSIDEFIEEVISDFGQYHSIDKSMYNRKVSNPILESLIAANRDFRDIDSRVSKIEALIERKAHVNEKRKADYEAAKLNWKHPLNSLVEPEREDWKL